MSQPLRNSIGQRLVGSVALDALVARDPNDPGSGALFAAAKNQAPPVYPCVTYRILEDVDDPRFQAPVPNSPSSPVAEVTLQLEAWSLAPTCAPIEEIQVVLDSLFKDKAWDLSSGAGRVFRSRPITGKPDLYDDKLNGWFGLFLYRLRIQYTQSV